MTRRAALVLLIALAGCGSTQPATRPHAQAAPEAGPLRVTATDLHLGPATVATRRGIQELRTGGHAGARAPRQGVDAGATCANTDVMPDDSNVQTVIDAELCLLNGARADAGLPPLTQNGELAQAALEHSQDMVANQYFDHVAPDGRDVVDRIRATGYIPTDRRWTVGENLAWGTGDLATPRNIFTAWMNSEGHRENILRPEFREIGFGVVIGNPQARDGQGATYTTNFGAVSGGARTEPVVAGTGTTSATRAAVSTTPSAALAARRASRALRRRHARELRAAHRRARAARRHR
jgi:uncharacterized protein YkwD